MIDPKTEDREITDDELDKLLKGFDDTKKPEGPTKTIIKDGKKINVPIEPTYIQNEEQDEETLWQKTKELDLPEPEKNEIQLPNIKGTDDVVEFADKDIDITSTIPQPKFTKHKNRLASDDEYRQKIEARINDLIIKLENKEINLNNLTNEDQQVIMDILNQDG